MVKKFTVEFAVKSGKTYSQKVLAKDEISAMDKIYENHKNIVDIKIKGGK